MAANDRFKWLQRNGKGNSRENGINATLLAEADSEEMMQRVCTGDDYLLRNSPEIIFVSEREAV